MSTSEYNKKLEEGRKLVSSLKKDLKYREDQQKRDQKTYELDSQIRGSFNQLEEVVSSVERMLNNFKSNPKDFQLSNKEIEKRQQDYDQIAKERLYLKNQFDSYFQKKAQVDVIGQMGGPPTNKPDYKAMNSKQLWQHKQNQQKQQQDNINDMINLVIKTKNSGKNINKQLKEQQGILEEMNDGMTLNIEHMGKVKRNMMKLLDESSFCCLVVVIILEIIAMILILVLWH